MVYPVWEFVQGEVWRPLPFGTGQHFLRVGLGKGFSWIRFGLVIDVVGFLIDMVSYG